MVRWEVEGYVKCIVVMALELGDVGASGNDS